jgi:hypothetical protein
MMNMMMNFECTQMAMNMMFEVAHCYFLPDFLMPPPPETQNNKNLKELKSTVKKYCALPG